MANQQDQGNREKRLRGFAAMDESKRREIARLGGKAAHIKGTAHEFTSEEARAAGRKGGLFSHNGPNATKKPALASPTPSTAASTSAPPAAPPLKPAE